MSRVPPPRWRCLDPDCPQSRRQPIRGRGDPVALGREAIDRHLTERHGDDETEAVIETREGAP